MRYLLKKSTRRERFSEQNSSYTIELASIHSVYALWPIVKTYKI